MRAVAMRTTGVKLIVDNSQANRKFRETAKETEALKDEVDETAKAGDRMGESLSKAGKNGGAALAEMRKHAAELDKQIKATESGLKSLAKGFANTGDVGILKAVKEQQQQLRELKNIRSLLPDAAEAMAAGAGIGAKLIGGIGSAFKGASPAALGAGAIGILLAPTVGAAVAGAVVGGAAGMGVIGGLVIASRDRRVKDAGGELGRFLLGDLTNRASGFVPEMLNGIERVRQGWQRLGPDLDRLFSSSRFVAPLTDGILKGGKALVAGLADAVENADPVVEALRNMFSQVGTDLGATFRMLSQDAKQGASALEDLTAAISHMIMTTATIAHAGAQVKGFTDELDEGIDKFRYWIEDSSALSDVMKDAGLQIDLTADGFHYGTAAAEAYRKATVGTATAVDFATLKQNGMTDAQVASADSSGRYRAELEKVQIEARKTAAEMGTLVASEKDVQEAQKAVTEAQQQWTNSLMRMNPVGHIATQTIDGLKKATDALYGSQERGIDANEAYETSWDALSESVKANKTSLDIHTKAGRANRDALQALLTSSRDMYYAEIESKSATLGVAGATEAAKKKHEARTGAIVKEAEKLGINKKETDNLVKSYGKIPDKKKTDIVLTDIRDIVQKMMDLYIYQRSLATGETIGSIRAILNKEKGPAKRYGGYHEGGYTGPGGKYQPAGVVHRDEYVIRKESRRTIEQRSPGLLDEMNATGQVPSGYASGGWVGAAPVETSRRIPYRVNMNRTRVPSKEQVAAKVVPVFSKDWPSSPSAQRGDSGIWRRIVTMLNATGPMSGSFGNGYRPGDPKWHGSGRAVDWMGYNQDRLATYLAGIRPLELIHRTKNRDYAYTRGVNKGSFNNALMEAHRNHIHIAMRDGGVIREPVLGVGASGRSYSFGEAGAERVVPMGRGGGGGDTTVINIRVNAAVGSHPTEIGREVVKAIGTYLNSGGTLVLRNGTKVFG